MIYIKHGSIFDEKCDLLVLPCDSNGGLSNWVRNEVFENDLPAPNQSIPFGNILFVETNAKYEKSEYVGFAASVDEVTVSSGLNAISNILLQIIRYADQKSCSIINLPLLGTGVGGLTHQDAVTVYREVLQGFKATVNIYIPDLQLAKTFSYDTEEHAVDSIIEYENPRVFISYSWDSPDIKVWVYELANKLCESGINARLDRFHLTPGMDIPQWTTNELIKSDKVLLICDEYYSEKADTRRAGVGWETMLIQGDVMLQGDVNTKYICVACGEFDKNIPIYMKSKLGMKKEDIDNNFKGLVELIFDIDVAPNVGEVPDWIKNKLRNSTRQ